jgi:prepilin-type N-terminal cleavage/methylation domain-containing protein
MVVEGKVCMKVHDMDNQVLATSYSVRDRRGFTLIELLTAMVIFSTVIVGLYKVYDVQFKQQVKEYRLAESEMELGIAKNLIERDLIMAGYGIMDDYSCYSATPVSAVTTSDGGSNPDTLTLKGTALGIKSRATQEWSTVASMSTGTSGFPTFSASDDPRENINPGDRMIITNPSGGTESRTKTLLCDSGKWLYSYSTTTSAPTTADTGIPYPNLQTGYVVYALNLSGETDGDATVPYYTVKYYLGGTSPSNCAPGTQSLLRAESRTTTAPSGGDPVMSCVRDFEVALGLTDSTASPDPSLAASIPINKWDNGATASTYSPSELNQRLKQIRVYILVQEGSKDSSFTYVNPDPNASAPDTIRVGELNLVGGTTGRDVQLTAAQRNYRWRVLTIVVTPRNIRAQSS